jgi:hypothetical protein
METIDWKKHYNAFKWAASKNWKHKNGLHRSIQHKIETLVQEYSLSERKIVDELFENYWSREHYRKFDETKGSLNNWIARYVCLCLNNLIRRHAVRAKNDSTQKIDPLDQRNWANIEWIDRDNEKEDLDYQPEIVFDPTNPEDLCIAKDTLEFISGHFRKNEIAYLMGEIELEEAADLSGCSCYAFRKRLERRRVDFKSAMRGTECR